MYTYTHRHSVWFYRVVAVVAASCFGCSSVPRYDHTQPPNPVNPVHYQMPKELAKVTLPPYIIEPPDILTIDVVRLIPRPPYQLQTGDLIDVSAKNLEFGAEPLEGQFALEPGGIIDLGEYGRVQVGGLTIDEARLAITNYLKAKYKEPQVIVRLLQMATTQQIAGEHLVKPDGTVTLGVFGTVYVTGMTLELARAAIEAHLSQFLESPEVAVDVFSFNSKSYYVVTEGAGLGDQIAKFPITGNETVLDALVNVGGMGNVSSKRIWIARPASDGKTIQILPVDWKGVTKLGSIATNYQLLPGDRVFIAEDKLVAFDTMIAKITAPVERLMGFSLLGVNTATRFSGPVLRGGGDRNIFGGGAGGGFFP